MFIHQMSESECRTALKQARLGRLACASDNQPYVVPIYFAFDGTCIYGFATLGKKIEWMRANPRVCLEIDEQTAPNQWISVVAFGRFEELPDRPEFAAARLHAYETLQKEPMWWEPGCIAINHRDNPHSCTPIFYRIQVDQISGRRATPNGQERPQIPKKHWWQNMLHHERRS